MAQVHNGSLFLRYDSDMQDAALLREGYITRPIMFVECIQKTHSSFSTSSSHKKWSGKTSMLSSKTGFSWESQWLCNTVMSSITDPSVPSSIMAARSTRSLTENRITHILSVCSDQIPSEAREAGIHHKRIPVEDVDYADLLIHLPSACHFIDQALRSGGVVLVHCVQGISRSAAVVAAYS